MIWMQKKRQRQSEKYNNRIIRTNCQIRESETRTRDKKNKNPAHTHTTKKITIKYNRLRTLKIDLWLICIYV